MCKCNVLLLYTCVEINFNIMLFLSTAMYFFSLSIVFLLTLYYVWFVCYLFVIFEGSVCNQREYNVFIA